MSVPIFIPFRLRDALAVFGGSEEARPGPGIDAGMKRPNTREGRLGRLEAARRHTMEDERRNGRVVEGGGLENR